MNEEIKETLLVISVLIFICFLWKISFEDGKEEECFKHCKALFLGYECSNKCEGKDDNVSTIAR